jgi:hypothetical protein
MNKFLTATFVALLSTAAFAQEIVICHDGGYVITGSEEQFTATRGGVTVGEADQPIQTVIDAIIDTMIYDILTNRIPSPCIHFGSGTDTLDISGDSVQFINDGTGSWPWLIQFFGKIKSESSSPTIKIGQGVSIVSLADIANVGGGYAIRNNGQLSIYYGTVSATNNAPVYHDNEDFPLILISGSPSDSPSIPPSSSGIPGSLNVSIYIASGKLEVVTGSNFGTEIYHIRLENPVAGSVVVTNGAAYADNFLLASWVYGLGLVPSGDDLVIGETTPIIKSKAASGFGIVLNGNSLQVVGISQATPISVYDLRGNVVMSGTALPNESVSVSHLPKGVYVAKVGGMAVKVVR